MQGAVDGLRRARLRGTAADYVKLVAMHSIQIADETFVAADRRAVGAAVADPSQLAAVVARSAAGGHRGPRPTRASAGRSPGR